MMKMKKQEAQKAVMKRKLKFQHYKNCLENKINHFGQK